MGGEKEEIKGGLENCSESRCKRNRDHEKHSQATRRIMKQGIFPPPLREGMGDFFLISITSLNVLALHSESFGLFCLLTMNL